MQKINISSSPRLLQTRYYCMQNISKCLLSLLITQLLYAAHLQQSCARVTNVIIICSPLIVVTCPCYQRYYYIQTTSEKLYFLLLMLLFNSKHFEKSIDFVSHDIVWRTPIPEPRLLVTEVNICRTSITVHRLLQTRYHCMQNISKCLSSLSITQISYADNFSMYTVLFNQLVIILRHF